MKRRDFCQQFLLTSGGLMIGNNLLAQYPNKSGKRITILHTNDTHSNIEPFPMNHSKYPGMGGVSKRFAIIEKIRKEEKNVLLLDSGDIFQGTPYFNAFHGILEMKLMSKMGYDASTMGNHDFDIGLDGFLKAKQYADFPFLCANYDFSNTILKDQTTPYQIIRKGGVKIGLFGIGIEMKGLIARGNYGDTVYIDPIAVANKTAKDLKEKGCDLIICLSHLGFEYSNPKRVSDRKLAQNSDSIHIILGGHTHTFLDEPVVEKNKNNTPVLINQVGWAGIKLGRIDIDVESHIAKRSNISVI